MNKYKSKGSFQSYDSSMIKDGNKDDKGKVEWSLMPFSTLNPILRVLMFGKEKYSRDNWKNVDNYNDRYFDALMRHLVEWKSGQRTDKESGLMTLAHAACCLLFLIWFEQSDGIAKPDNNVNQEDNKPTDVNKFLNEIYR